jgi:hypothetical protein
VTVIFSRSVSATIQRHFLMNIASMGIYRRIFGLACVDGMLHQHEAHFDFLRYEADETRLID